MISFLFFAGIPIIWICCYIIGSIPVSYIFAKIYGVNLLQVGTKNPGGLNAWRSVNPLVGILGGSGDILKGTFALWPNLWISDNYLKNDDSISTQLAIILLIVGSSIAVILGHQKSIVLWYLEGSWIGGKGMGTFGGILLAFSFVGFLLLFVCLMGLLQIPKKLFKIKTNLFANIIVAGASLPIMWFLTNNSIVIITLVIGIVMMYLADQKALKSFTSKVSTSLFTSSHEQLHTASSNNLVSDQIDTNKIKPENKDDDPPTLENTLNPSPRSNSVITPQQHVSSPSKDIVMISFKDYITLIKVAGDDLGYWESYINSINVFPVPDGDTGTNMVGTFRNMLTFSLKLKSEYSSQDDKFNYFKMILDNVIISGLGNSGLIFTQWWEGVLDTCHKKSNANIISINIVNFQLALKEGYIRAYNSMQDPKEGTILTLMKAIAELEISHQNYSLEEYFLKIVELAFTNLKNTSRGIKKLVGVQVIDAGALCFAIFINAFAKTLFGKGLIREDMSHLFATFAPADYSDIKNGFIAINGDIFCLQFTFESSSYDIKSLQKLLENQGTAIKISQNSSLFRIHIHTHDPDYILSHIFGDYEIRDIHIDNMKEQIEEQILKHR